MKDFVFKKKFGQNFISDKNLLNAIAEDAEISSEDEVLEIGAGAGSLTEVLGEKASKVVSFEIDKDLQQHLLGLNLENVEFIFQDFMKTQMQDVESRFSKNYKVVANLPYYITTPIIFRLLEESSKLDSLTIMVQKEVAERICASVGGKDYGILTVMTNFYGMPKITRIIKRQMFFPVPNVDSALLNIKLESKYPNIDAQKFSKFVKACFSMRRKTLLNNLSTLIAKEKLKSVLDEQTLGRRAETISLQEFVILFEKLSNNF
ncbi:MAG: ribosomal RNA small subunit methyltransferase A [Clostridiales bacterium]|nr:ribosomal RNA small subunit methyltransferase A [Clostridiales bacterium]